MTSADTTLKLLVYNGVFSSAAPPSISGSCDHQNFYILVKYGTPGFNFQTIVGKQMLTSSLAQQYNLMENGTHLSFAVPFSSPSVVFEVRSACNYDERLTRKLHLLCDFSGCPGVVHKEQTRRSAEESSNKRQHPRIVTGLRLLHNTDWFVQRPHCFCLSGMDTNVCS